MQLQHRQPRVLSQHITEIVRMMEKGRIFTEYSAYDKKHLLVFYQKPSEKVGWRPRARARARAHRVGVDERASARTQAHEAHTTRAAQTGKAGALFWCAPEKPVKSASASMRLSDVCDVMLGRTSV